METYITLLADTYTTDSIGQQIKTTTETAVPATVTSASRSEWVSAGQNNFRADLVARTPIINYSGERRAACGDTTYAIYRTYRDEETDMIELYLQEEGGVRV